jgi:nitroreductase
VPVFVSGSNIKKEYVYTTMGAMTQNIHLAAESMGIGGRFVMAMNEKVIREGLKLKAGEYPLNLMLIDKK